MTIPIPYSVLDLAMVTEGNTPTDAFRNSVSLAQHTEQLGYRRYWLAEHHNMEGVASTATVVLMAHLANQTKTLRIGSGGIMLPNHAPLVVAEQFGTLATLHPHRIDLGLGRAPGTDQLTANALRRDMKAVMDFEGNVKQVQQFLSKSNQKSAVRAIPGEGLDIPIWILGSSVESAYIAASLGLPYVFASHFAPAQLFEAAAIYREHFTPSAQLDKPYFMPCVNVIAADTTYDARKLATSFKKLFLGILTGKRQKMQPPVDPDSGYIDPLEEAALQQMIKFSFVGDAEKIAGELEIFLRRVGADEIMITTPVYHHQDRLRSYEIAASVLQSMTV
ncbi:LLM class flavin-dependent oxidoreductase [Flavobacterium caeni]|uniref:Luciferase-like monooxygenase n=1 Tax=Flavobacterium caeni TaxID=490189 RepID=A0A1G5JIB0_9FLAO|nr:LLM class flavin-dependent oxidoreductase [Flavobacterium caeni]SCY88057.1 luciferase family oxidoreductase, group 1 [Flavobacterium caeni]